MEPLVSLAHQDLAPYVVTMISIAVTGTVVSRWGEGPVWWRDALYYVDIEGKRLNRFDPVTGDERHWEMGQRIGFVVPRESGGFVIGGDDGLYLFEESGGELTAIADPERDKPDNRFNDGKCSPEGRLFTGTISLKKLTGDARLYRLDSDLTLSEAFGPVTNSNGLGWSPDGKTMYYIDTPRREVLAFDYRDGELSAVRSVINTGHIDASPDGMAVDENGHLWIAFCHAGCVARFDPVSGSMEQRVDFPCIETTACAFGGPDLADLYVTTGIHATKQEENAGRLFVVRGLGVRGLPVNSFAG